MEEPFWDIYKWVCSLVVSGARVTRSLVLCVCFIDCCLSFYTFSFWSLCCLFFFDLRILSTPLVSSNSSYGVGTAYLFCVVCFYCLFMSVLVPCLVPDVTYAPGLSILDWLFSFLWCLWKRFLFIYLL
jgi:hypothetical protein